MIQTVIWFLIIRFTAIKWWPFYVSWTYLIDWTTTVQSTCCIRQSKSMSSQRIVNAHYIQTFNRNAGKGTCYFPALHIIIIRKFALSGVNVSLHELLLMACTTRHRCILLSRIVPSVHYDTVTSIYADFFRLHQRIRPCRPTSSMKLPRFFIYLSVERSNCGVWHSGRVNWRWSTVIHRHQG